MISLSLTNSVKLSCGPFACSLSAPTGRDQGRRGVTLAARPPFRCLASDAVGCALARSIYDPARCTPHHTGEKGLLYWGSPRAIPNLPSDQALDHGITRSRRSLRIPMKPFWPHSLQYDVRPGRRTQDDASSRPRFQVEAAKVRHDHWVGSYDPVPLVVPPAGGRGCPETERYGVSV